MVNFIETENQLITVFQKCLDNFKLDSNPREKIIEWILQNTNKKLILNNLIETFKNVAQQ